MSFAFPAPCTSYPFERETYVSSPLDSCEVSSIRKVTKCEDIDLSTPDLKCCGKQNNSRKYVEGTVSLHKQAKNPTRRFMILSYRSEAYFRGMLADVFINQGQNLKENGRKLYTS